MCRAQPTDSRPPAWRTRRLPVQSILAVLLGAAPAAAQESTLAERLRQTIPERLQRTGFLLEHWQWIALVLLVAFGVVLQRLLSFAFRKLLDRLGRAERIRLDRAQLARFERPLLILIIAAVFLQGLHLLDLEPGAYSTLYIAGTFALAVAGVWACYGLVDVASSFLAERAARTDSKSDDMFVPLLRRTLKLVVLVTGAVFLLSSVVDEEQLWTIVAGLSIGSLAIGFAAKDSIENLFGTFTVLLDKPFQLGDYVRVEGNEGTVEDVGFRSTRLRTPDDSLVTVPNAMFIRAIVDNLGARRHRRVRAFVALTYDTPAERIEAFCEAVREAIRKHSGVRQDNFLVLLFQMSASSLDVLVQIYVVAPDFADEARERHWLFQEVLAAARRTQVTFAFPTQTLYVQEGSGGGVQTPRIP